MESESFIYIGVLFFLAGAAFSLLPNLKHKHYLYILPALGSLLVGLAGFRLLFDFHQIRIPSLMLSSYLEFNFGIDVLSGFFVLVISLLACAVSIYSIGYTKHMQNRGLLGFLYNLFILSMYAVVAAGNIITFLIAWEAMSLLSYFLVTFERDEKSAKAGLLYIVMTHVGTAFIIVLFLLLYRATGTMTFGDMSALAGSMPVELKSLLFVCAVIGFGTKAGIIPLHTWLPRAHPAAPSTISALMSGVMLKIGIYGLVRVSMDILGAGPGWWGVAIIIIGAVSSLLGVMYALMEHDLKRLLAYHSVENIGIIFLGLGSSLLFKSYGLYALSALALAAALYHTLNHALFKGLLFLGAGAVLHSTGTKNMEKMGGLLKVMPLTGLFFLIGSLAICAFPPFNGFVSEWLTFQSLLLGFASPSVTAKIIAPLGGAALALTSALAAACFVKAFGISFLGMPRTADAAQAHEAPRSMSTGMALLAVLCLIFGIFPRAGIEMLSPAIFKLTGSQAAFSADGFLSVEQTGASLSPMLLLVTMLIMFGATALFVYAIAGRKRVRYDASWDCGIPALNARMQYTATAFTKPIRRFFKRIYLPRRELNLVYTLKPLFVKSIRYKGEITPFFERYIYEPLTDAITRIAERVKHLQSGNLQLYLGYILITLIVLLIFGA